MRVLYVALTRAKEKLIITGMQRDYQKSINKKEEILDSYKIAEGGNKISKNVTQKYISYLDWIELVYIKCQSELEDILEINIYKPKDILKSRIGKEEKEEHNLSEKIKKVKSENIDQIKEKLEWEYEYKNLDNILTKSSVTKIKNMKLDLNEEIKTEYKKPEFMKEEKELTGAEKGSLMHLILQKLDEKVEYNIEKVQELVNNLESKGIISKKQREVVDIEKVHSFTKTDIWQEMKNAKEVYREKPFYINIPVNEIYDEDIEENILVQGIIDLYYITEKGEIVLVDYKTDKVNNEKEIIEKYKEQLILYKKALEKALGRDVNRVYIYSIYMEKALKI